MQVRELAGFELRLSFLLVDAGESLRRLLGCQPLECYSCVVGSLVEFETGAFGRHDRSRGVLGGQLLRQEAFLVVFQIEGGE